MLVVEPVGERNQAFVEAVVTDLVTADEQNGTTPRIERVEHTKRVSAMLDPKLPHVRVPRTHHARRARVREGRSVFLQLAHT